MTFKIRQNAFPYAAPPGPRWGAHDAPPDAVIGWGTPSHTLLYSAPSERQFRGIVSPYFPLEPRLGCLPEI